MRRVFDKNELDFALRLFLNFAASGGFFARIHKKSRAAFSVGSPAVRISSQPTVKKFSSLPGYCLLLAVSFLGPVAFRPCIYTGLALSTYVLFLNENSVSLTLICLSNKMLTVKRLFLTVEGLFWSPNREICACLCVRTQAKTAKEFRCGSFMTT